MAVNCKLCGKVHHPFRGPKYVGGRKTFDLYAVKVRRGIRLRVRLFAKSTGALFSAWELERRGTVSRQVDNL